MTPRVSVCIPTYNGARWIGDTLRAVAAQRFRDFEVVVSDDGSTDTTVARVLEQPGLPRLRCSSGGPRRGAARNWQCALDLASPESDYAVLCCQDDLPGPMFLACAVAFLDHNPSVAFVHTAYRVVDDDGQPQPTVRAYSRNRVIGGGSALDGYLTSSTNVLLSSAVMRRSVLRGMPPLPSGYACADFLLWCRLAMRGDVGYLAEPLVTYRRHAHGVSGSLTPERWAAENLVLLEMAMDELDCYPVPRARYRRATERTWSRRMVRHALAAIARGDLAEGREAFRVAADLRPGVGLGLLARACLSGPAQPVLRGMRGLRKAVMA